MKNNFLEQRLLLGAKLEKVIMRFLRTFEEFEVIDTSSLKSNLENNIISDFWKKDSSKEIQSILMLRWLPDLLVINKKTKEDIFIDIKLMYTPIYLDTFPNQIKESLGVKIKKYDIGNIEREAYKSYMFWKKSGVKVAVLALSTFNPKFLICEYVDNIELIHMDKRERNKSSSGSTTPRVNFNLSTIGIFKDFLNEFLGYQVENKKYEILIDYLAKDFNFIGLPRNMSLSIAEPLKNEIEIATKRDLCFINL